MDDKDRKAHWENIYETKPLTTVSWYQPVPKTSLTLIDEMQLSLSAKIIDVGGGDSFLVDHLLQLGYQNITVLDISSQAIKRAQKRLGKAAEKVKWIVADITTFCADDTYDLWHDRATFHFLTNSADITAYYAAVNKHLAEKGKMIIGTFSEKGPSRCSGITIKQYSAEKLSGIFGQGFRKEKCFHEQHHTPSGNHQDFVFCCFEKS
ncbi:class I SAM-dependent methyltransferase [Echinicola soli]|uniref:Class I SAM-dependent methyltransferase n=1 Tax=Echinicola soli TaxID=2591634 RepID=A0A514CFH7_9BACT|nr:class I SAM-dependent methyltransferase [Echinicola soli]QDH78587.1 class I SAM-dependent methyltransferase [Echinicola soli]